jgi:hypothetical protein
MSARTLKSEYLVLSRGTSWHKTLTPEDIERMSAQFTAWFERLSNEGKIENGHRKIGTGNIIRAMADRTFRGRGTARPTGRGSSLP